MNLSCAVIGDLLPLYAEGLTSADSAALVREHLEGCEECRRRLEALRQPAESIPESAAPMDRVKKELRRRRRRSAGIAALAVFLILFAALGRVTDMKALPYTPGILRVEGTEPFDPADTGPAGETDDPSGSVCFVSPEGWQPSLPDQALVLLRSDKVAGVSMEHYLDEETGELTVYVQCWGRSLGGPAPTAPLTEERGVRCLYGPAPDRVIYGFGSNQALLWGEPMNGGMEILPRLALGFYASAAGGLGAILALAWFLFRRKPAAGVLQRLCLASLSWPAGHLLVKGTTTESFFLGRDMALIAVEALAVFAFAELVLAAWRQTRADRT